MGIKKHPVKNLSLKWSFALYVGVCLVLAGSLSILTSNVCSVLHNAIYNEYEIRYSGELAMGHADLVLNGQVVQKDAVLLYKEDVKNKFSSQDRLLYNLYNLLAVVSVPVICVIGILLTGALFYRRKLKRPLVLLDEASTRIAGGDLNFHVAYDSQNELGRLAASFESMRRALEENNREMWRMMEQRKRLNAAFAHDLRTPLTVLKGYCEFLLKYVPGGQIGSEKVVSTLAMMESHVQRLEGYTQAMGSLQKLEEIAPVPQAVFFVQLCADLKNTAGMLKGSKTLTFTQSGTGDLSVDTALVFQVCENLIANAARFGEKEVSVSCDVLKTGLEVTVSDDGPGFSKEALKKATEPYYRDHEEEGHLGIGLYICKLLCEKHGGGLLIENTSKGARVTAQFAFLK